MNRLGWWLTVLAVVLLAGAGRARAMTAYRVGVLESGEGNFASQFALILKTGSGIFERQAGFSLDFEVVQDRDAFFENVHREEFHFLFSPDLRVFLAVQPTGRYTPFGSYELKGETTVEVCLRVPRKSPVKTLADARGLRAGAGDGFMTHLFLRDLLGETPETFFKPLSVYANNEAAMAALIAGDVQAALVDRELLTRLELLQPAALKGTRNVGCANPAPNPPLMVSANVPPEHLSIISQHLKNIHRDPAYKQLVPFFKQLQLRLVDSAPKDYEPLLERLARADKSGERARYEKWRAGVVLSVVQKAGGP